MKPEILHLLSRCAELYPGFQSISFGADPKGPVRVLTTTRIYSFEGLDHIHAWAYGQEAELAHPPKITIERAGGSETEAIATIVKHVAEAFRVDEGDIRGTTRTPNVAFARQVCMVLARSLLKLSYQSVAKAFQRDHGTIMHAVKTVENIRDTEPKTRNLIRDVQAILENELPHLETTPLNT